MNQEPLRKNNWAKILALCACVITIFIFLKNAWISEDAYITFRSIEQLFAGRGPIWNPHERVQVFTSPLWFWMLAGVRLFTTDIFLGTIILSFCLLLVLLWIIWKTVHDEWKFLLVVLLLAASNGFFDYTSSGLENILAYGIIAGFTAIYFQLFFREEVPQKSEEFYRKKFFSILMLFGLLVLVRHDLSLLLFPGVVYLLAKKRNLISLKKGILISLVVLLPLIIWSVFSLIYYGFPFPNTAYAKLNTGISNRVLAMQGFQYFISSLKYDPITLILIGAVGLYTILLSRKHHSLWPLLVGIFIHFLYVGYIGGDFMRGRFFSYAYLIAVLLFAQGLNFRSYPKTRIIFVVVVLYLFLFPHTPFNSPFDYGNDRVEAGIADERGIYFRALSLRQYWKSKIHQQEYPSHIWCQEGKAAEGISVFRNVGLVGYCADLDAIIIDQNALTDPLLARIPVTGYWRIGHFQREIPPGYLENIAGETARIENYQINGLYQRIVLITQSEALFSAQRLREIVRLNLEW